MPDDVKAPPRFNPEKGADEGWSNADRAVRAHRALETYSIDDPRLLEPETALADLLGDLLHLCDRENWGFDEAMARARKYHAEER